MNIEDMSALHARFTKYLEIRGIRSKPIHILKRSPRISPPRAVEIPVGENLDSFTNLFAKPNPVQSVKYDSDKCWLRYKHTCMF